MSIMPLEYKIVIPSHKRNATIHTHVFNFLRRHNIDFNNVYVFVDEQQYPIYKDNIVYSKHDCTGELAYIPESNLIQGDLGIRQNRNCIADYFSEDTPLVSIDDDLTDIFDKNGESIQDLDLFIKDCLYLLLSNNLRMCGVCPYANTFFFKDKLSTDLKFCAGAFRIYFNTKLCENRRYNLLEDYETTIAYYNYSGGIARINNIGFKANYKTLKGGIDRKQHNKKKEVAHFNWLYYNHSKIKKEGEEIQLIKNPKKERLFTLWVNDNQGLPRIQRLMVWSVLRQGYILDLYTNVELQEEFKEHIENGNIVLHNPFELVEFGNDTEILPLSDLWRFEMLYKQGGTWIDSDMILLQPLRPGHKCIVSSEHTMQSGAFKSKLPYVMNIGLLRFEKGDALLETVLKKIRKMGSAKKITSYMKQFNKDLVKWTNPGLHKARPEDFCPVPWWDAKEIYQTIPMFSTKYNVEVDYIDNIIKNSNGIHLWNNITKDLQDTAEEGSLFDLLEKLILK